MGSDFSNKNDVETLKIKDIAKVFDGPHATPKKLEEGPYFLSISSLVNGKLDLSKSARLSEQQFDKWTKRVTPEEGDVLFSYETRLGEAALMPGGVRGCLGRRMGLLRPDREKVIPEYLLYAFLGPEFQTEIKKRTIHGATVERISLREFPDFFIKIPSLAHQRFVVHTLSKLDRKIDLNHKTNQTLEQMAQALFKSWFIDFDPVLDNALAAGNPIPEPLQTKAERRQQVQQQADFSPLPADIRALFPSEFEQTDEPNVGIAGWMPKGWESNSIHEMVDTISKTFNLKAVDKVVFLNTGDIDSGEFLHSNYSCAGKLPGQAKKSIKKGDILFSEIRPKNKRYAFVDFDADDYVVSTKLMVLRAKNDFDPLLPYFILTLDKNIEFLNGIAEHRSGTFPQITFKELEQVRTVFPVKNDLINIFVDKYLVTIFAKKAALVEQNKSLEKIRDTLLPKLISGEIALDQVTVE